jgi:hypothetical protein
MQVNDAWKLCVRGCLELPVRDGPSPFVWGVWVELSEADYARVGELWNAEGREREPAYSSALASSLTPHYPSALGIAAKLETQPVGQRPLVLLDASKHPLAIEQRDGIRRARVREIAECMRHMSDCERR